jgi:membrane protein YqaA with SNARE-associated domain
MVTLWLSLIFALIVQEFASAGAALIAAQQNHLNFWLVNVVWLCGTIFDILFGYLLAKRLKTVVHPRWVQHSERRVKRLQARIGKYGENIALLLLAIIDYPWLNSFIGSWLDIPFKNILICTLIGNLVWYAIEWAGVLGIVTFAPHFNYWLLVAAGGVLVVIILWGVWRTEKDDVDL